MDRPSVTAHGTSGWQPVPRSEHRLGDGGTHLSGGHGYVAADQCRRPTLDRAAHRGAVDCSRADDQERKTAAGLRYGGLPNSARNEVPAGDQDVAGYAAAVTLEQFASIHTEHFLPQSLQISSSRS